MRSQNYETNGYTHSLDLPVISHLNFAFHIWREENASEKQLWNIESISNCLTHFESHGDKQKHQQCFVVLRTIALNLRGKFVSMIRSWLQDRVFISSLSVLISYKISSWSNLKVRCCIWNWNPRAYLTFTPLCLRFRHVI